MSIIQTCDLGTNINPLNVSGFRFVIHRIPEITYFCHDVDTPGINLSNPRFKTSLSSIPVPGDMLEFDPIKIKFTVDSEMKNYMALFKWIRGLGFPDSHEQYKEQVKKGRDFYQSNTFSELPATISDASLIVLDNFNKPFVEFRFIDCVIMSLSGLEFTSKVGDAQYLVSQALFEYQSFDIEFL